MHGYNERRTEIRVPLSAPLFFNRLDSLEAYARIPLPASPRLDLAATIPDLEGRDDIEVFLMRLDAKLDYLITLLSDRIARKNYQHKGLLLDISESGLRFVSPIPLPIGALLEIELVLPNHPHHRLDIAAQVIWQGGQANADTPRPSHFVGLGFLDILPDDREEIVHYIFQKQREEIRRSKE